MPSNKNHKRLEEIAQRTSKDLRLKHPDLNHIVIIFDGHSYSSSAAGNEAYCMEVARLYVNYMQDRLEKLRKENIKNLKKQKVN